MFINITLQTLNLTLNVFNLVLTLLLGRVLIVYSRYGGTFASSVRWIFQGGVIDMVRSSYISKNAPASTRALMMFFLILSIFFGFSTSLLSRAIQPSQTQGQPFNYSISNSIKMESHGTDIMVFSAFKGATSGGKNVADAIFSMTNVSFSPPDVNTTIYKMHTSEFIHTCNQTALKLLNLKKNSTIQPYGCADLEFQLVPDNIGIGSYFAQSLYPNVTMSYKNHTLQLIRPTGEIPINDGMPFTSTPVTDVTKSWTPTNEMIVISMTTTQVYSSLDKLRGIIASQFGDNPLFNEAIENLEKKDEHVLYNYGPQTLDVAICIAIPAMRSTIAATCFLVNIDVLIGNPWEPKIDNSVLSTDIRKRYETIHNSTIPYIFASIQHLPLTSTDSNGNQINSVIDTKTITEEVANLTASMGYSLNVGPNEGFGFNHDSSFASIPVIAWIEKIEINNGFEIPLSLIVAVGVTTAILVVLFIWTLMLDGWYTKSFYEVATSQLLVGTSNFELRFREVEFDDDGRLQLEGGNMLYENKHLLFVDTNSGAQTRPVSDSYDLDIIQGRTSSEVTLLSPNQQFE